MLKIKRARKRTLEIDDTLTEGDLFHDERFKH